MAHQPQPNQGPSRETKKAQFSRAEPGLRKRRKQLLAILGVTFAAIGTIVAVELSGRDSKAKPITAAPGPAAVKIPVAELADGKAKFFTYSTASNKTVRFFVMRSSDGVYRAAFDACDECFHAKQGYFQDGDDMVCRKCGRHFRSTKINEVSGGCNPIGVSRVVADGQLMISARDLESGAAYF